MHAPLSLGPLDAGDATRAISARGGNDGLIRPGGGRGDGRGYHPAQHPPDDRQRLPEPAQPLRKTRAELDAEVEMLLLEPGGAKAEDRPAAADLVERRGHLRHEGRVADRIRPDHETDPDALGRGRPGGDRQPSLEDGAVRVADDRVEVVPRPQGVIAEPVRTFPGLEQRRPVRVLVPAEGSELHIVHLTSLARASAYERRGSSASSHERSNAVRRDDEDLAWPRARIECPDVPLGEPVDGGEPLVVANIGDATQPQPHRQTTSILPADTWRAGAILLGLSWGLDWADRGTQARIDGATVRTLRGFITAYQVMVSAQNRSE